MVPTKTKIRVFVLLECDKDNVPLCQEVTNTLISDFVAKLPASVYHKVSMTAPRELDDDIPF